MADPRTNEERYRENGGQDRYLEEYNWLLDPAQNDPYHQGILGGTNLMNLPYQEGLEGFNKSVDARPYNEFFPGNPEANEEIYSGVRGQGGTFGDAKAGVDLYSLLKLNKQMGQYNENRLLDPTSKANVGAYTEGSDVGYFEEGGFLEEQGLRAIQTDQEELVVFPDMSIVETASRDSHKEMKKGDITDILPIGSFIASDKVMLDKRDYEDEVIETFVSKYEEGKKPDKPKEVMFTELWPKNKNKVSVKKLVEALQKRYEVITDEQVEDKTSVNPLRDLTNQKQKLGRAKWMARITEEAEKKSPKKKKKDNEFKFGGVVKPKDVEEFDGGGFIKDAALGYLRSIPLIGGQFDYLEAGRQAKEAKETLDKSYKEEQQLMGLGTMASVLAQAGQDSRVDVQDYGLRQSQAQNLQTGPTAFATEARNNMLRASSLTPTREALKSSPNIYTALKSGSAANAQLLEQLSKNALADDASRKEGERFKYSQLSGLEGLRQAELTTASNKQRGSENARGVNIGTSVSNLFEQLQKLKAGNTAATLGISGQEAGAKQMAAAGNRQGTLDLFSLIASGGTSALTGRGTGTNTATPDYLNGVDFGDTYMPEIDLSTLFQSKYI